MKVLNLVKWLLAYLWDKIILLLSIGQKINELESYEKGKEYSENFLRDYNRQERIKKIWATLFNHDLSIDEMELNKIYRLNFSSLYDLAIRKIKYYIENRFWSLLDFFEIDTWSWKDKDVFGKPSLVTYAIFKNNKTIVLIIASLQEQKYTLIKSYEIKRLPLWKFKKRQCKLPQNSAI